MSVCSSEQANRGGCQGTLTRAGRTSHADSEKCTPPGERLARTCLRPRRERLSVQGLAVAPPTGRPEISQESEHAPTVVVQSPYRPASRKARRVENTVGSGRRTIADRTDSRENSLEDN